MSHNEPKWRAAVVFGSVFWYPGSSGVHMYPLSSNTGAVGSWRYRSLSDTTGAALPRSYLSSTALVLFTFLRISPFPWARLSILLTGIEKDNFVDHYCVITVISGNYFSTPTSCWKDAQGAPCSAASATLAGRLLPAHAHGHAAAHTHSGSAASLPSAPFFVSFQQFSKIMLFNRRNFASCWAPYMYFSSECPFNLFCSFLRQSWKTPSKRLHVFPPKQD